MIYFKAIIKEQTQTEFGIVPKSQEYYIPATNYEKSEKIFKELIKKELICIGCLGDGEGNKVFEIKKILKEEISDVVGDDSECYYKIIVRFSVESDDKSTKTSNTNMYVSAEDAKEAFEKVTEFIKVGGYLCDHEIVSIVKKDKIKTIFKTNDEDYVEVTKNIV